MASGLLRPALELALIVARFGEGATPPVAAPGPLRKLLLFARLPDHALATLRRVVEEDAGFRARVAEAAVEDDVGRPSWLWLVRPDGWQDELAALDEQAAHSASSAKEERDERGARRRLVAAEEARRRAEAVSAAATSAAARAGEELVAERQVRRRAELRSESLAEQVAKLEARVAALQVEAGEAVREAARRQEAETALVAERDRLRERVGALAEDLSAQQQSMAEEPAASASDATGAAVAIADAAAAARQLGVALAAAARALGGGPLEGDWREPDGAGEVNPVNPVNEEWHGLGVGGSVNPEWQAPSGGPLDPDRAGRRSLAMGEVRTGPPPVSPPWPGLSNSGRAPRSEAAGRKRGWPRRQAAALPPAVFEDSATAADHLLRIPGMVLLVDGYNVTLQAWPGMAIPEQRRRLVDALAGLAARTGAEIQVVFDGAEQVEPRGRGLSPRSPVRVRFSPPDVDADDVLIDLCEVLPVGRPVTVATSDRRVQDEVRKRGGNVITTPQLLGVIAAR